MKRTTWHILIGTALFGTGCIGMDKALPDQRPDAKKTDALSSSPKVTAEQVNEQNAAQMANALSDELTAAERQSNARPAAPHVDDR